LWAVIANGCRMTATTNAFFLIKTMLYKQLIIIITSSILLSCVNPKSRPDADNSGPGSRHTDCISSSSIRGYSVLDESNLIVDASGRRSYHVVLRRRAYGISSAWGIAFPSTTGRICAGFDEVVFDGHAGSGPIAIASIRELTGEDREDLLIQFGKKKPEIEQTPEPREVKGAEVEELDPAADGNSSGD